MLLLAVHNLREPASAKVPFSMVSECAVDEASLAVALFPARPLFRHLRSSFTCRRSFCWTVFPRSCTPRRFVAGMLVALHIMRRSKQGNGSKG